MISRLVLTARTAARLRPRQCVARVTRSVRRLTGPPRLRAPNGILSFRDEVSTLSRGLADRLASDELAAVRRSAESLRDGVFRAVGKSLEVESIDWTGRPCSHLFSYHLHYFDDAPALAWMARQGDHVAESRLRGLWEGWLDACGGGRGDGWDPYPIATRIPNWTRAIALLEGQGPGGFPNLAVELRSRLLESLWTQGDRLRRTLEHDLGGNHLLRNRTALVWIAAVIQPPPVPLAAALEQLVREVDRQVLSDGMHEERTPAYHASVLEDLMGTIELLRAVRTPVPASLEEHARGMREVLGLFVRADGGWHSFGDTTPFGSPTPAEIESLADRVLGPPQNEGRGEGPWHLSEAGFAGARTPDVEVVLDCGPFGPRHQPGHGHCDGLSFVLSLRGIPVVVDPGIAGYEGNPHRRWARGTAAHNTVQVDGREQTEIWATFRAARRARPGEGGVVQSVNDVRLHGAISPYHAPRVLHERAIVLRPGEVEVLDRVRGGRGRRLDTRLHFAPGATFSEQGEWRWEVRLQVERLVLEVVGVDGARWEDGPVFPGWGRVEEGPVLHAWIDRADAAEEFGFRFRVP